MIMTALNVLHDFNCQSVNITCHCKPMEFSNPDVLVLSPPYDNNLPPDPFCVIWNKLWFYPNQYQSFVVQSIDHAYSIERVIREHCLCPSVIFVVPKAAAGYSNGRRILFSYHDVGHHLVALTVQQLLGLVSQRLGQLT